MVRGFTLVRRSRSQPRAQGLHHRLVDGGQALQRQPGRRGAVQLHGLLHFLGHVGALPHQVLQGADGAAGGVGVAVKGADGAEVGEVAGHPHRLADAQQPFDPRIVLSP